MDSNPNDKLVTGRLSSVPYFCLGIGDKSIFGRSRLQNAYSCVRGSKQTGEIYNLVHFRDTDKVTQALS